MYWGYHQKHMFSIDRTGRTGFHTRLTDVSSVIDRAVVLAKLEAVVIVPRKRRRNPTAPCRHQFASGIKRYSVRVSPGEQM
jgi:hypothetical protein